MFVYLFVWETLSIPEETRDTRGRPQGDQQEHHREANELKSKLVHMSLIETPAGAPETPQQTRDTSRSTREKLDVIIQ